jgi:endo-1,3(4)-beta-glucanase
MRLSVSTNIRGFSVFNSAKVLSLTIFLASLTLQACGGGGGGGSTPAPTPTPNPTPDTTKPIITLNGDASLSIEQGTPYTEANATADDAVDGPVDVVISGTVDTSPGTYTLTYTAVDAAGNSASITRTVTVTAVEPEPDTTKPVITLNGEASLSIEQGTAYTEANATAVDAIDGSVNVVISGTVGSSVGTYTLTYTAVDAAGNSASITRTVTVTGAEPEPTTDDTFILNDGVVEAIWGGDAELSFFDSKLNYGQADASCSGTNCDSVDWKVVTDADRGDVLQVSYTADAGHAGLVVGPTAAIDLSDYADGNFSFDIKLINAANALAGGFFLKIESGVAPAISNSGELPIPGIVASGDWQTINFPVSSLTASGAINLSDITAPMVFFPKAGNGPSLVYQIDNVRFSGISDGATPPTDDGGGSQGPTDYTVVSYGAGSIADTLYTASHRCKNDYGYWVENAGVISTQSDVQIKGCDQGSGIPTGNITKLYPQLAGPAAEKPTQTHKWWGSVSFLGEMTVGDAADAAYITPDPITARITDKGVRVAGIPSGMRIDGENNFYYPIPDHAAEVFDGIAIGNSEYSNLEAFAKDHSAGSVTVLWKSGDTDVMEATFVHGSPYVYFKAYSGNLEVRTFRQDGGEKGTFSTGENVMGIWTSVASNSNNYLIVGEGATTFTDTSENPGDPTTMGKVEINNSTDEMTLVYLPHLQAGTAPNAMVDLFASKARNPVAEVDIDYQVNAATNEVTVTHSYLDDQGNAVDTIAGMHPLHWKNTSQATTSYKVRSARGMVKFAEVNTFSYQIPYVGVLPTFPVVGDSLDQTTLKGLVTEFVSKGSGAWNLSGGGVEETDTYWTGKNYGKVAELAAIARSLDMQSEADQLVNWLKAELADWFTAETDGTLNTKKYFVYDDDWNTLLGFDESFGSHQRLADHHFHYGYFVRAAAEICRVDLAWCGDDQYGPMIELLIRDYAADTDDALFPHMRNFDPANGFSWADGQVNFTRGNNNESTSEAATAYGAIILYGLTTGNTELTERGMYLHASTGAAYWEYWNNIDGYNNVSADADNFPSGYNRITTSIIWGDGAVFSTWFSGAFAHILGIQGLPSSPLILHVGLHADYMKDYVALGLSESSNGKPSGLLNDQWRDLWWNLWAMVDADAAIADYNSAGSYTPEAGETKAHTYHWLHTFNALGQLKTGTGALTSDYPSALAFDNDGVRTYVVYNFTAQERVVSFSDGKQVTATANGFTLISADL